MARMSSFRRQRAFGTGMLSFDWVPDPVEIEERVLSVAGNLRDTRLPLAASAQLVSADILENFVGQHDPEGRPWHEWSERYEPYAIEHNIGDILQQTMELQDAATDPNAFVVSGDSLFYDLGNLPERGLWHQEGRARTRGGNLPARPFLGLSDDAAGQIFITFSRWFDRTLELFTTKSGRVGRRMRGPMGRFVGAG